MSKAEPQALLTLWERRQELGEPVACVATTFTFDEAFFEEECLARFVGIESDAREEARVYVVEREEQLSRVQAFVMVDPCHVPKRRSLRWNVVPVRVGRGIMHAKVTLLAWSGCVRLIVGSANLTPPGYRTNLETVGWLEIGPDGGAPHEPLLAGIDFLLGLTTGAFAPGGGASPDGPRPRLRQVLEDVRGRILGWPDLGWRAGGERVAFVPVMPDGRPLAKSIAALWKGTPPSDAWVLSPFYDPGNAALGLAEKLVEIMGKKGECTVTFIAPGRCVGGRDGQGGADGEVQVDAPAVLAIPRVKRVRHRFEYVAPVQESELRSLHAKGLWLERHDQGLCMIGSSNFTSPAWGVGKRRNVEANLAYLLPDASNAFARHCDRSWPASIEAPGDAKLALEPREATEDHSGLAALHPGFGEALFRPGKTEAWLELQVGPEGVPSSFRIASESERTVLDHESWMVGGRSVLTRVRWTESRPPSYLMVTWTADDGSTATAAWTVNVTDPALLPPPDELRDLPLEILFDILTSSLPLHEAMRRAWVAAERRSKEGEADRSELDPHRKVDTRAFLLQRVRRVSKALEGLRARLARPAHHAAAFRWRLHGPIGPLALASRLAEGRNGEAAFMIAEVALTVRRIDWSELQKKLGADIVRSEVDIVVAGLSRLAAEHPSNPALSDYVRQALEAVRR